MVDTLKFVFGAYKFTNDGTWITYRSAYGKAFRVALKDITAVSVDETQAGKGFLKLIGHGTSLAEISLPRHWAYKAQTFIQVAIA